MRKIANPVVEFWGMLSFAEKISLVASAIGVMVMSLSIGFSAIAYHSDKEAYLFELQTVRVRSDAMQFQSSIARAKNSGYAIAAADVLPNAADFGMTRLPENDEAFIFLEKGKNGAIETIPQILFRASDGTLMRAKLGNVEFPPEDGTTFAITSEGSLIANSRPNLVNQESIMTRPSVSLALKSNLTEGTTSLELNGQKQVVAYRELPDTNVTIFSEISMKKMMIPFMRALAFWLAFGFVVVLLGAVLSFWAVKKVAKPAQLATERLLQIAHGDFLSKSNYSGKDEFKTIFNGIDYLAQNVATREKRLNLVGDGLKKILSETVNLHEGMTPFELAARCAEILEIILSPYSPTAYAVSNSSEMFVFSAKTLDVMENAPAYHDNTETLEIPVYSPNNEPLLTLLIFGVRPSLAWPETMQTLAQLSQALASYFARCGASRVREEQARHESELALAASIQKCLVTFPGSIPSVEIAQHYNPAEKVGGDWASAYFDAKTSALRFFLGDVTGHGVAPSLVTAAVAGAASHFQDSVQQWQNNARCSEGFLLQNFALHLNDLILKAGGMNIGMTMVLGSLNCETGELTLVNLGHPIPVPFGAADNDIRKSLRNTNNPLGSLSFERPNVNTLHFTPGQGILIFTDGLLENYPRAIHKKQLLKIASKAETAEHMIELTNSLYNAASNPETPPGDDVALLAIRWLGGGSQVI
jgi:serine phosphatase RsbU (regulator of sigma subunit)